MDGITSVSYVKRREGWIDVEKMRFGGGKNGKRVDEGNGKVDVARRGGELGVKLTGLERYQNLG